MRIRVKTLREVSAAVTLESAQYKGYRLAESLCGAGGKFYQAQQHWGCMYRAHLGRVSHHNPYECYERMMSDDRCSKRAFMYQMYSDDANVSAATAVATVGTECMCAMDECHEWEHLDHVDTYFVMPFYEESHSMICENHVSTGEVVLAGDPAMALTHAAGECFERMKADTRCSKRAFSVDVEHPCEAQCEEHNCYEACKEPCSEPKEQCVHVEGGAIAPGPGSFTPDGSTEIFQVDSGMAAPQGGMYCPEGAANTTSSSTGPDSPECQQCAEAQGCQPCLMCHMQAESNKDGMYGNDTAVQCSCAIDECHAQTYETESTVFRTAGVYPFFCNPCGECVWL